MLKNRKIAYKGKIYKADKAGHCKFLQDEEPEVTTE